MEAAGRGCEAATSLWEPLQTALLLFAVFLELPTLKPQLFFDTLSLILQSSPNLAQSPSEMPDRCPLVSPCAEARRSRLGDSGGPSYRPPCPRSPCPVSVLPVDGLKTACEEH